MTSLNAIIDSTLQNQDVVMKQESLGILRVTGLDAKKFLQGQTTCDVSKLSEGHGLYGAICNIKGRIITSFYLVQSGEDILMLMSEDLVEKTQLHLKKYAVFFKAELINDNEAFSIYTKLSPKKADSELFETTNIEETLTLTTSVEPLTCQYLIVPQTTQVEEQQPELAGLNLLTARPLITEEQSETVLPQWLNMQSTGGISFTKGCYTGQEIVARMQYKGKSKKQLGLISWQGQVDTSKGLLDDQGKNVGQVFATAEVKDTHYAQVIFSVDPSELTGILLDETQARILPLPYSLAIKK